MIRNYLKIAVRNLWKNKVFSGVNLLGLVAGLTACLLILQYVSFELSFDRFQRDADRIYRVTNDRFQQGKLIQHGTITYPTVGKTMANDYQEIDAYTTLANGGSIKIRHEKQVFQEDQLFYVDEHFLAFFTFPLLAGNPRTALNAPRSLVLTESNAQRIFGVKPTDYATLIGRSLLIDLDNEPYQITGILEDVPATSHLQFGALVSYETLVGTWGEWVKNSWESSDMWHYLKLKPGVDALALERKFPAFSERYFQGDKVSGSVEKFYLQPLTEAHLYSDYEYEIGVVNNGKAVWTMLIIAAFILLIAWINYINLATARSLERAKEVGVRKVAGATMQQLMSQFLSESVLLNLLALGIALGLAVTLEPVLVALIEKPLSLALLTGAGYGGSLMALVLAGVFVLGVVFSGFYPAFALSSFQPISVLKGTFKRSEKGIWVRKSLVVFQYTASVVLIVGTFIVFRQLEYMRSEKLGFNLDQTLVVSGPALTEWDSTSIDRISTFKGELTQYPAIKAASASINLLGNRLPRTFNVKRVGANDEKGLTLSRMVIDLDFFDTYQIDLLAGRNFLSTDSDPDGRKIKNIIINASAAALLGFEEPGAAVGQKISFMGREWDVVGVVRDFHQQSLRHPIEPILFAPFYSNGGYYSLKIATTDLNRTLELVKQKYQQFFPGNNFSYFFMDEQFNRQYKDDQLFGKITTAFSLLAVLIASLGLFGLSSYTITQRTKEIGVRKVLGASVGSIVALLSRDFLKLVLVAILLATPLAWYATKRWLDEFAYKIDLSWWIFALAGTLAIAIALLTVSFQSIRAALMNPVKSLRSE
ncbi:ABC transporter permease [Rhabdobacter roseus]|uniref:Putative ABC transport system permease protein n=1 Tax=Rhabdobacter roseus TaxID=1655419 RepID=A0A840TVI4_9BACT|nr:ABC transporter permease [Rhabdobacter roseus]MBB5285592.1 putative ABC transport system permease protein [Rhabdobacter roseus]